MNQKAALAEALLEGKTVSIRTGFLDFGITNVPREISRSIEDAKQQGFGVLISRSKIKGKSRFGVPCWWFEYRLEKTEYNKKGRLKMFKYVLEQRKSKNVPNKNLEVEKK